MVSIIAYTRNKRDRHKKKQPAERQAAEQSILLMSFT